MQNVTSQKSGWPGSNATPYRANFNLWWGLIRLCQGMWRMIQVIRVGLALILPKYTPAAECVNFVKLCTALTIMTVHSVL